MTSTGAAMQSYSERVKLMVSDGAKLTDSLVSDAMFAELIDLRCMVESLKIERSIPKAEADRWLEHCVTLMSKLDAYEPGFVIGESK